MAPAETGLSRSLLVEQKASHFGICPFQGGHSALCGAGGRLDLVSKVERGLAAQHLLNNELFKEVLETLDGIYHAKWRVAQTVEAREDLHRYVTVRDQFVKDLLNIATTGKLEEKRLEELEGKVVRPPMNEWKRA